MRRHLRNPWVWIAAALLFALWMFWPRPVSSPGPTPAPPPIQTSSESAAAPPAAIPSTVASADALPGFLPPQARATIELIQRGGPFPHRQDGSTFGNREGRLPQQPRGYYREYTVDTPGLDHRGARRIVTGGQPPAVWYYSDDHYESFRAFSAPRTEEQRQ